MNEFQNERMKKVYTNIIVFRDYVNDYRTSASEQTSNGAAVRTGRVRRRLLRTSRSNASATGSDADQ